MRFRLAPILLAVLSSAANANLVAQCSNPLTLPRAVALQNALFTSLLRPEDTAYKELTGFDFVVFENGRAFSRDAFFSQIKAIQASGGDARWSVANPSLQADCNLAVMTYQNVGQVAKAGRTPMKMRWLESTTFKKSGNKWKLVFATSMRESFN